MSITLVFLCIPGTNDHYPILHIVCVTVTWNCQNTNIGSGISESFFRSRCLCSVTLDIQAKDIWREKRTGYVDTSIKYLVLKEIPTAQHLRKPDKLLVRRIISSLSSTPPGHEITRLLFQPKSVITSKANCLGNVEWVEASLLIIWQYWCLTMLLLTIIFLRSID